MKVVYPKINTGIGKPLAIIAGVQTRTPRMILCHDTAIYKFAQWHMPLIFKTSAHFGFWFCHASGQEKLQPGHNPSDFSVTSNSLATSVPQIFKTNQIPANSLGQPPRESDAARIAVPQVKCVGIDTFVNHFGQT